MTLGERNVHRTSRLYIGRDAAVLALGEPSPLPAFMQRRLVMEQARVMSAGVKYQLSQRCATARRIGNTRFRIQPSSVVAENKREIPGKHPGLCAVLPGHRNLGFRRRGRGSYLLCFGTADRGAD
jgi:hypothetical protein